MTKDLGQIRARRRRAAPGSAAVFAARFVIFWERLWPVLLPALAPPFLLVVASLFGLWRLTPAFAHLGILGLAAGASLFVLIRYGRELVWPARREALARLEADGRLAHAPLQALEDRPFGGHEGPLWRAHLADMRRRAQAARLDAPRATADRRDPWGLRYVAPGLLLVALVAAGPERNERLADLLHPGATFGGETAIADLWIEPPAYTGRAPIYLLRGGETVGGGRDQIDAPEGSVAVAQTNRPGRTVLAFRTPEGRMTAEPDAGRLSVRLDESGLLSLRVGGVEARWPVGVLPDDDPEVWFTEDPSTTDDARLALAFAVEDDYGVAGARLEMRLDPDQKRPLDAPNFDEEKIRARRVIDLDGVAGRSGERRADIDLEADPWAGLGVLIRIVVVDGAGQTGATDEVAARLPARRFFNPLARSVIEQRQTLAVAAQDWRRAGRSLDALTIAPERFYERPTDYLLMRTAFRRVMREGTTAGDFADEVEQFWPLALQLEDEALELARRRLEAARDALREALERGAGDDELSRLVEEMRNAMRDWLEALARSGQSMAEGESGGETLRQGDLDEMLDAIRNLSQSGARNAARQALSELENILNNLRLSSRGQGRGDGEGGAQGEGSGGAAGEAGDLIGRQRELSNRSFDRGREPGAAGDDLAEEENALAGDLADLIDRLRSDGAGADPDGAGARALSDALGAMREAESALGRDNFDAAGSAMERAIEGLRDGARALAEAQGRMARGERGEDGRGGQLLDPLGRPVGDAYGDGVEVPEGADPQRARDLLQELRRRLSDGERREDEIDYLERLLERF